MGKKRVTCLRFSSTFSSRMPLDQTLSHESMPRAPNAPSDGYRLRSGSCMPCRPSLLWRGTALPKYSTRQRQIGVESPIVFIYNRTTVHNNNNTKPHTTVKLKYEKKKTGHSKLKRNRRHAHPTVEPIEWESFVASSSGLLAVSRLSFFLFLFYDFFIFFY